MTLELFNIIVVCASDTLCWTTSYLAWLPELPDILRYMICFFYLTKLQVLLLECHNVIYLFTYRTVSKDKNSNHPLSNLLRVGMIFLSIRQHWSRNNDINWDFLVIGVQLHGSFSAIELFFWAISPVRAYHLFSCTNPIWLLASSFSTTNLY